MKKDFIYYGLFLDKDSKNMLWKWLVNSDIYALMYKFEMYLDHCTLLHCSQKNDNLKELLDSMLELNIPIGIDSIGISDKAVAFSVKLPKVKGETLCNNKHPHITIATMGEGKPVDSNYIEYWKKLEHPLYVEGKLKVIRK